MLDKLLPQILIVEHQNSINISLYNAMERVGFNIMKANNLEKAFTLLTLKQKPDLIIINIFDNEDVAIIINKIRKIDKLLKTPLIFLLKEGEQLLAHPEINTLVAILYSPFSSDQLINTIKNLLRRSETVLQDNILKFKNLSINLSTQRLYKEGKIIHLGPTEFRILQLFLQCPTTVFSREKIIEHLWENEKTFNQRVIDVHINRIREALSDNKSGNEIIKTVRFMGYCLNNSEDNKSV